MRLNEIDMHFLPPATEAPWSVSVSGRITPGLSSTLLISAYRDLTIFGCSVHRIAAGPTLRARFAREAGR